MVGFGRQQADYGTDSFAALERLRSGDRDGPENGEPYAAFNRSLCVVGVGDYFKRGDAQVDALGGRGGGWLVHVLLDLAAHWTCVKDGSFHGTEQAVRECSKRLGRRGVRLHFCAPCAQ